MHTRRTLILLAALLTAALATSTRAQADFNEWERRMLAGEFASAANYARQVAEFHEESAVWAYRTAAALARAGDADSALKWFSTAAERGYSGVRTIETDADIDPSRSHPAFKPAADRVRANAAARLEVFKAAARDAEPIVIRPPGHRAGEPTPVLLALHGSGGTGRDTARQWRRTARQAGAILIAPDALRPRGDGYGWTFRDESEWYVQHLLESAQEQFAVGSVILAGFSQGANIALAMGRSHPDLFDAVLAVGGHWQADVADLPPEGDRPRWMLLIGEDDPWAATYDEAATSLTGVGMTARVRKVPGLGHAMPHRDELSAALDWCLDEDG